MHGRKFSKDFKLKVLQELEAGKSIGELGREYEIRSDLVRSWKRQYESNPETAFSGKGNPSTTDSKVAQLERKVGQLYLENEFVKKVNNNLQVKLASLKKTRRE